MSGSERYPKVQPPSTKPTQMMALQLLPTSSRAETILTDRSPKEAAPQKNLAVIHSSMDGAKALTKPADMNRAMKRQMVRWRPILSARIPAKKTPTPVPAKKTKEAILDMILLPHTRSQFSMIVFWNWLVS